MVLVCWAENACVTILAMSISPFFFFSSRRRHTRCSRDWSSDVCSSDLIQQSDPRVGGVPRAGRRIALADMLARPVQAPEQVTQVGLERLVALGAPQPSGFAEVFEGAAASGAAQAVGGCGEQARPPLPHGLDEAAERRLEDGIAGFETLLLGALLAQV